MSNKINGAEIFAVGTHNGLEFSEKDIDAIVAAFDALGSASRVPLKFGHNDEQPFTDGQPALGWVERVWKDGGKLLADFTGLPEVVYNAIKKGLYKHVSVELLKDFGREGARFPWVLDAVALLGADIPAVRGLKDLQALTMARALPGVRFAQSVAFTQATVIGDQINMSDEIAKLKADLDAANKRAADAEAAREKVEKERFAEKVATHRETIKGTLEHAVTEGRIAPAVRDRVLNSRYFKDDQEVLTVWTKDAVNAEIESNKRADFKEGRKPGATSVMSTDDKADLTGKSNAEVLTFKAQKECLRVGGKIDNFDDLSAASARVLKAEKALATAYFSDPQGTFNADAA